VAVIVLPFRTGPRFEPTEGARQLDEQLRQLGHARQAVEAAARGFHARLGLMRWRASGTHASLVVLDESVPVGARPGIAAKLSSHSGRQAHEGTRATVFVYSDSTRLQLTNRYRAGELDVTAVYALPEVTDGQRCVALLNVRRPTPSAVAKLGAGPCAFYAVFGAPGPKIREWLLRTNFAVARDGDALLGGSTPTRPTAGVFDLPQIAAACVTRAGRWCRMALGLEGGETSGQPARPAPDGLVGTAQPLIDVSLGGNQARFLSDMAVTLGTDRFSRFWRSAEEPSGAFATVTGESLEAWTQSWLERGAGQAVTQASLPVGSLIWIFVAMPVLFAVSVRGREKVR
jgi:hypothetical protein